MKKPTFENTVNILVNAYLNDTLEHNDCAACAVGNIISANGYKFINADNSVQWLLFIEQHIRHKRYVSCGLYEQEAINQINATGYSPLEISKIELAFEGCAISFDEEQYMFNGLMAVLDVLAEIHNVDLSQKEEAKKLFQKV